MKVPDRLAFYDYIGHNPAKGGLFRVGPLVNGDGIAVGWLGHPNFVTEDGTELYARRMPAFFETFPVILVDQFGVVLADQPFRRAESKYSLATRKLNVTLSGGALHAVELKSKATVSSVARSSQFGELLDFDRSSPKADGVFRTSPRGWFSFGHFVFSLLFLFGHWWHASRTLYRDVLSGIGSDANALVEFGANPKVG